jgi:protein O-GlcNAc transferase
MSTNDEKLNSAIALHRAGRLNEARKIYSEILIEDSRNANALHLSGLIAYQLGKFQEAARSIDAAISQAPTEAKYLSNRGNVAKAMGEHHQALRFYQRALESDPAFSDAHFNMGVLLQEMGDLSGAAESYQAILNKDAGNVDAGNNLGLVRMQEGNLDDAERLFKGSGRSQETLLNLAILYERNGRLQQSEATYRNAFAVGQPKPEAFFNLGCLLDKRGKVAQAIEALEKALELEPNYSESKTTLRHQYMHACSWSKLEALNTSIDDQALRISGDGRTAETPFFSVVRSDDASANLAIAKSWASHIEERFKPLFDHGNRITQTSQKRLKIGYLSNDIQDHATAHLMGGLFAAHDRNRFSVNIYSYGPDDGSPHRQRIAETCDLFVDIRHLDFKTAAHRIHSDDVDILVDLKGWTRGHRLAICAHRPAPVQATYLGFPGSTGATFFDYAIVDRTVVPPTESAMFSETLAYLPHCYQANDGSQPIADNAVSRLDHSLPGEGIVFCCFNSPYKIEPEVFTLWMEILSGVPNSVLWLYDGNDVAQGNLRASAKQHGINPDRLVFAAHMPKDQHLRRMQLADLALDTWTCNGHTTTSDALWAGVPVIALEGRHFASRVSASCLIAVGMQDLIAGSPDEYRKLAVRIAHDEIVRTALKSRLWTNRNREPLFDTVGYTRALEKLFMAMWERYADGLEPGQIWACSRLTTTETR